jgi:predicted nucleic-acid-binding Zn-ribbon protein
METGHDDQHKKYCILVCHNCGYIRQSKLEGGKDE